MQAGTTIFPAAGNAVFRGLVQPVLQSQEWEYDPSSGYTFNQVYFGWDFAAMTRYANWYNAYGVGTRIKFENGKATLYTRDATLGTIIDRWEMQVDQTQPSMFENELFNVLINKAANRSAAISLLRLALGNATAANNSNLFYDLVNDKITTSGASSNLSINFTQAFGDNFLPAAFDAFNNIIGPANLVQLNQYFDDYSIGVTNFISGRYTLRHTTNAPNRWQANIADFNVDRIYTISQLLSETQNSGLWVLPLPGYLAYKIATYFVPNLTGPNYMWGALKTRSSATSVATSRVEIVTEYLIDQINTLLYYTI